jgi:phage baseplate assembly protein V
MSADQLMNYLNRAMAPLKNRVMLMIGRAVIAAAKDANGVQQVQVSALAGESMDKVERFQNFGFTANPPANTEAIFVCLGGNRDNMVIIATDNRALRLQGLAVGESAQYDKDGNYIKLKTGGILDIKTGSKLKIMNGSEELITVLDDLFIWLEGAHVITAMGPQKFVPADLATLAAIKTRLESFKV